MEASISAGNGNGNGTVDVEKVPVMPIEPDISTTEAPAS
jgi:hypothetical protein